MSVAMLVGGRVCVSMTISQSALLPTVSGDFASISKSLAQENKRKDSDKLEKELKTHGFAAPGTKFLTLNSWFLD